MITKATVPDMGDLHREIEEAFEKDETVAMLTSGFQIDPEAALLIYKRGAAQGAFHVLEQLKVKYNYTEGNPETKNMKKRKAKKA